MKYLRLFETTAAYDAAKDNLDLPNVSYCEDNNEVHYKPWVETRVVATFNVTSTSGTTRLLNNTSLFSAVEIDGVEQPSVETKYTFSTTGEHTVKYTLIEPTSIGESAFSSCSGLTNITIPSSVTSIGNYAFAYCSGLTSITIPDSVTSIGSSAFTGSGLTSITIPSSVTSIGNEAFKGCSGLTSITIPNSVTSIGNSAFYECSGLTSVTIGSGVTSIGNQAFFNCTGLTSITSNATAAPTIQSATFQSVNTNGTLTVPSGSTGYDVWMGTGDYYLGKYGWTKVEQ